MHSFIHPSIHSFIQSHRAHPMPGPGLDGAGDIVVRQPPALSAWSSSPVTRPQSGRGWGGVSSGDTCSAWGGGGGGIKVGFLEKETCEPRWEGGRRLR